MMAAHEVLEKTGAKLAVFAGELDLLNSPDKNCYNMMSGEPFRPFEPDIMLRDGDTVIFGKVELRVMHTPGHTGGSCCFLGVDSMFSGDTLFRESSGRTDFATGDAAMLKNSLARIFAIDGDLQVLPGHGEFTTLGYERRHNPLSVGNA
jgi:glyoxylase-like metal-dependent hydrolase (beta-lactamase superfamily II)